MEKQISREKNKLTIRGRVVLLCAVASLAPTLGLAISIVTTIFALISVLILIVSAINIAHTFFMIIAERRREIGILRAIGANRLHIAGMILGEAALLGLLGGVLGVAVGRGAPDCFDWQGDRRCVLH